MLRAGLQKRKYIESSALIRVLRQIRHDVRRSQYVRAVVGNLTTISLEASSLEAEAGQGTASVGEMVPLSPGRTWLPEVSHLRRATWVASITPDSLNDKHLAHCDTSFDNIVTLRCPCERCQFIEIRGTSLS